MALGRFECKTEYSAAHRSMTRELRIVLRERKCGV